MALRAVESGFGTAARVPERENLDPVASWRHAVVEMVANAGEVNAPDTGECGVAGTGADGWMQGYKPERPFEFIDDWR